MSLWTVLSSVYLAGHHCMTLWNFYPLQIFPSGWWTAILLSHSLTLLRFFKISVVSLRVHFISHCPIVLSNSWDPPHFHSPSNSIQFCHPRSVATTCPAPAISFQGAKSSCKGFPQHDSQYKSLVLLNFAFNWDLKSLTVLNIPCKSKHVICLAVYRWKGCYKPF